MPGYELIGEEERDAVLEVFDRGAGVLSRYGFDQRRNHNFKVLEFEKRFAEKLGVSFAQAVTSGTAALKVAFDALGVKSGDEVVTQAFTFVATVEAILETGAKPVICEVDETFTMDPSDLASRISSKTKAIVPVHMLGAPANMEAILEIAAGARIPVVEDTAQALGARYGSARAGALGSLGTFSFDIGKALTTGEGGMVVTNDADLFKRCQALHDHGHDHDPNFPRGEDTRTTGGFNFRMTELQGAIGLAQLDKLDRVLSAQMANWELLRRDVPLDGDIKIRRVNDGALETYDSLVVVTPSEERARLISKTLEQNGMGTKILPESVSWHFSGTWTHLLKEVDVAASWPRTADLLRRSVAVGVPVLLDEETLDAWNRAWRVFG